MSVIDRWKNWDICKNAGMNAEAHQEAIPACATTWRRTRDLMQGAQLIGRMGDALSTDASESASGLDAALRPDDALDGVLEGGGEPGCAMGTGWTTTAGEKPHCDF